MIRVLFGGASAALICLSAPAVADEVKGATVVKVQDPKRGSIPELIYAYGMATPTSSATQTASFQRDGMIAELYVEVGDQFKQGDKLLDSGASPAAAVTYKQALTTRSLKQHAQERMQQLFKQQLATRDDVENAEKDLSDAQSTVKMLEEIGSIKDSEILTAPFDGVVTAISVNKGDRISAGTPLMTLSRPDHLILSVGVGAGALAKVKPDLPVAVAKRSIVPDGSASSRRDGIPLRRTRIVRRELTFPRSRPTGGPAGNGGASLGLLQGNGATSDSACG